MAWNPLNEVKFKVTTFSLGAALFFALIFREGYKLVNCGMGEFAINVPDKVYELTYDEDLPAEYTPGNVFDIENTQTRYVHHNIIELAHVQSVDITPSIYDLSALNYMTNVEEINIDTTKYNYDLYRTVDGSVFKKPVTIKIIGGAYFCDNNFSFLKDVPVIKKLTLGDGNNSLITDSKFLESLTNVQNLEITVDSYSNINYNDLTYLDSLTINGSPYDVAIFISNHDIKELEDAGVEVNITLKDELIEVNKEIDEIIASLNITDDMTDQEKLNKVIGWVLTNYHYDDKVSQLLDEDRREEINHDPFYGEGMLTASIEGDSQICGNYAAMITTLLHRVNIESYITRSDTHAWNTVKIDGEYYTVDATNLDNYSLMTKGTYAYILDEYREIHFLSNEELKNLPDDVEVHYIEQILDQVTAGEIFLNGDQGKIDNFKDMGYMTDIAIDRAKYDPLPQISYFIEPDLEVKDYNELYKNRLMLELKFWLLNAGAWSAISYIVVKSKVLKEDSKNFVKKIK